MYEGPLKPSIGSAAIAHQFHRVRPRHGGWDPALTVSALPRVPAAMVGSATRAPRHRVWLISAWDPGWCHRIRVKMSGSKVGVGLGHCPCWSSH